MRPFIFFVGSILWLVSCSRQTKNIEDKSQKNETEVVAYNSLENEHNRNKTVSRQTNSNTGKHEHEGIGLPSAITGSMAYHIDDSMYVGNVSYAELKIGASGKKKLIQEIIAANKGKGTPVDSSDIVSGKIRIGQTMKARLIDPHGGGRFRIISLSSEQQKLDLSGDFSILWQWGITPLEVGVGELVMSIELIEEGQARSFPVYEAKVTIAATGVENDALPWGRVLLGIGIVALLILLYFLLKKKRNKDYQIKRYNDIFISYRRADSAGFTISLHKELEQHFKNKVFKDIDDIPAGRDFREVIRENLEHCKVVLVVIGPSWVRIEDKKGHKRIFDEEDFVNLEIATAIALGKTIIPVLVDGAQMPNEEELPFNLQGLAFLNAINLPHDNWDGSVDRLVKQIRTWL